MRKSEPFFYLKMKTYTHLYEKLITKDNFELAYINSIKGKASQRQIQYFNKNKDRNLEKVRQLVIDGKFHTSRYRWQRIYEPKERIIYKLPYSPDRIVQHAIMNILKPIFTRLFIENSYACIENRGQLKATIKCNEYIRRNTYCLKCDIHKFYPSINQHILSDMLHKIVRDSKFMAVVDDVIFSFEGGYNCPIGNYLSQWCGNFYLTKLDNYIKHELKCSDYERYCDDFLLFSNDKNYLNDCRMKIEIFLRENLELEYSKADLFHVKQGVDFCGYRCFGKYVLVRKSTGKRIKKRIRHYWKKYSETDSLDELKSMQGSVGSAIGWTLHACSNHFTDSIKLYKLKNEIDKKIFALTPPKTVK